MSKVAKFVAKVAAVVAIVATVAGIVTGNPFLVALGAAASAVSAGATIVAQMTAKKPPSRGSPNLITIGANQPMPIVFGETYIGGNKVHEVGYGGLVAKVENPYKFEAIIHSGCGPVESITGLYADFEPVTLSGTAATGYFSGFLYADQQLGARAEADALVPNWASAPGWGVAYKLSGYAATGLSLKFDKDGKIFASGEPQWGVTIKGVKAYDARLDSTYPGGSGPQRINNRSTWAYSENPGVVGATYAYGWFDNANKQGGIGMPVEGIDMARWVEFANICDANEWKVGGVVYEPGSRWDNLKDICAAGGGEPYFDRHLLGVNYNAPRVSLDTITADDIADEGFTVASGRTWRERLNTIAPKYRSGAHKWEYVPGADVSVPAYITDDGEEKREEIQWNLVQDKDQVAQLAAYELVNRREIGQIEVNCKPRLMRYSVGDMLTFNLPGTVINGLNAVIIRPPAIDPQTGQVKLTMVGETDAKHDFALGKTSTAPPVPSLVGSETLDNTRAQNGGTNGVNTATVYLYQRNDTGTAPALPTVPLTYTFATALLSGGSLNGWSQSVPSAAGGKYLFVTTQVAASDALTYTLASSGWATVQILAQDGTSGTSAISGFLTKETIQLFSYANGGIVSYAPAAGSFKVFSGNTDVSTSFTLSTLSNPEALTVSYTGQTYSVTAGFDTNEDTATLGIRATGSGAYAGVTIDKLLSLSKAKGGYEIVSTLPATDLFEGRVVFLTTDDKLYRYTGSAWTSAVPAVDISGQLAAAQIAALEASKLTGQITSTQITDGAISSPKISAGAVIAGKLAADSVQAANITASAVTAGKIAANAVTATEIATNAITADKILAGAITAAKVATNEIVALSANIKDGVIQTAKIGDLQVSTLKIANFAVNSVSSVQTSSSVVVPAYTISGNVLSLTFTKVGGVESNVLIQMTSTPNSSNFIAYAILSRTGTGLITSVVGSAGNGPFTAAIPLILNHVDTGLSAGTYTYSVNFDNQYSSAALNLTTYAPVTLTVQEVKK